MVGFPLTIYKTKGQSMEPTLRDGDWLLVLKYIFFKPVVGDIVVAKSPKGGRLIVKRVILHKENKFWLSGDNNLWSTDSRKFGPVDVSLILGKVIYKI